MHKMEHNSESASLQKFISLLCTAQTRSNLIAAMPASQPLQDLFTIDDHQQTSNSCCSLPCLKLRHEAPSSSGKLPDQPNSKRRLQESCAERMSTPCHFKYDELNDAPDILLANIKDSFKFLVKSRLASSINAFVEQSSASKIQKKVFVKSLTKKSVTPFELVSAATNFQLLGGSPIPDFGDKLCPQNPHGYRILFSANMDVNIMGESHFPVSLEVLGYCVDIGADSDNADDRLKNIRLTVDTDSLLKQMIEQARRVAKKALEIAAGSAQYYIKALSSSSASLVSLSSEESQLSQLSDNGPCSKKKSGADMMAPPRRRPKLKGKR